MNTAKNAGERPAHGRAMDVNRRLILNFRDVSHTMRALYEGRGSQKRVLIVLLEEGGMTQSALTARLGIRAASASEVIAKLESAGLLMRTVSREDRRTADLSLTQEGLRRAQEARRDRERRHEQMFACLSQGEKEQLLALLERLTQDWRERFPAAQEGEEGHGRACRRGRERAQE